jgi:GDP-L-fucose synthase
MPTNLYGPNDNFDLEKSHVLPALLRKIHLGRQLEAGDWDAVRTDLRAHPVEGLDGDGSKDEILQMLSKYGVSVKGTGTFKGTEGKRTGGGVMSESTQEVFVEIWGSGTPLREFMYSEDMAAACLHVMESAEVEKMIRENPEYAWLNIGTGREITIRALAELIKEQLGFRGDLVFNADKPDGTPRKLTDPSRLHSTGFKHSIELEEGIGLMYKAYLDKQAKS